MINWRRPLKNQAMISLIPMALHKATLSFLETPMMIMSYMNLVSAIVFEYQSHEKDAMLNPSLRSKEGYRPFDMKTFEVNPNRILQVLRNKDLEAASVALAFFNSKFPHRPPYIVEQVFGHQPFGGYGMWWHSNFKASRKDGSPSKLFFVEYYNRRLVPFCCILDETSCVRGCLFCGEEIVHPDDDRVLKPVLNSSSLDNGNPPACPDIEALMSRDTVVIRDTMDITKIFAESPFSGQDS